MRCIAVRFYLLVMAWDFFWKNRTAGFSISFDKADKHAFYSCFGMGYSEDLSAFISFIDFIGLINIRVLP